MIQAIAIDDEPLALNVIEQFCQQNGKIQLLRAFTSCNEAILFMQQNAVQLLFLDINMPAISGIELYQQLPDKPPVIFTTAYAEYAVEGFNLNAIDYLLKPFTFKRFQQAIAKFEAFLITHNLPKNNGDYLVFKADYSKIKVAVGDIEMVESLDNYIKIHFKKEKPLLVRLTMKNLIKMLPPQQFIRIHRSYVVPIKNIKQIRNKTLYFDGFELPIGTIYEKDVFSIVAE